MSVPAAAWLALVVAAVLTVGSVRAGMDPMVQKVRLDEGAEMARRLAINAAHPVKEPARQRYCVPQHFEGAGDHYNMDCELYNNIMHSAISEGDMEKLIKYLKHGAGLDDYIPPFDPEHTPLISAVAWGELEVVNFLLELGANMTKTTPDGYSAVDVAASHGRWEILEILLAKGVDPNLKHSDGYSAIHRACTGTEANHTKAIEVLLDHGVDVNEMSDKMTTPLDLAEKVSKNKGTIALLQDRRDQKYDGMIDLIIERSLKKLRARGDDLADEHQLAVDILSDMWHKADKEGNTPIVRGLERQMERRDIPIPGEHIEEIADESSKRKKKKGKKRPRKKRKRKKQ